MRPTCLPALRRIIRPGVVLAALSLVAGTACSRPRPVAVPVVVALEVPPPPDRVISTPPEPVAPIESTTVERPAPVIRPARSRVAATRQESSKPADTARVEPDAEVPPAAPEPAATPGPLLRTPQTADENNAERRTKDVLGRASGLLDRVNLATLGQQARQQLETARRFVIQAQQALVERNLVLASYLADKAETLARGLSR